ncbi:MAG: hypothetical protein HC888_05230 [Candidatus Competibacteraceae bacterium]|nr:hypothetical protein [Candidatus Competibacteraceae bacterium]
MMAHYAFPCPCRHPACKSWMVEGVADVQGVNFTEQQARVVAGLLNFMDEQPQHSASTVALLLTYQNRS